MKQEVPQFIDVEDKVFGPFTFKQFIYLAGGAGLAYLAYKIIPFPFSVPVVAIFAGFGLALAFYKLNGRPFIEVMQYWVLFQVKNKLYIWKRVPSSKIQELNTKNQVVAVEPIVSEKKRDIGDLARNLDILDNRGT